MNVVLSRVGACTGAAAHDHAGEAPMFHQSRLSFILSACLLHAAATPLGAQALTLNAAVQRAVANHPRVAAAQRRIDAALGSRRSAGAWMNPSLTIQQEGEPSGGAGLERKTTAFAMIPLAPLYQRGAMIRMSASMVAMARADLARTRQGVALDAARAFNRAALAQVDLESATEVKAWLDSLVAYTTARVTEGIAAEADLLRLTVESDRAAIEVTMQSTETRRARADLAALLSLSPTDDLRLQLAVDFASPDSTVGQRPTVDELVAIARRQRPDLAAAQSLIDQSRADRSLQHANLFRDVSGMVGTMSMSGQKSLMFGATFTLPAFNMNGGEVQRAAAEFDAATLDASWAERQMIAEVTGAFEADRALAAEASRLRAGFLGRAEESRRIALATYREGAAPLFVVIDAARTLSEARSAYYRLLSSRQLAMIELNAAIGADDLMSPLPRAGR